MTFITNRAEVNVYTQIGIETTPGTKVAATKRPVSTSFVHSMKQNTKPFTPEGFQYNTEVPIGMEWSEYAMTGPLSYNEMAYWLCSALISTTSTQHSLGTLSWDWAFTPPTNSSQTIQTYTIEKGDAIRGERAGFGFISDYGYTLTRDSADFTATMMAQQTIDPFTMTALTDASNDIASAQMLGQHFVVYADPTAGAIGTTKLVSLPKVSWSVGGIFSPFWTLNSTNSSFDSTVNNAPNAQLKLLMMADSVAMAYLTNIRTNAPIYFRIQGTGPFIEGAIPYLFTHDIAAKFVSASSFQNANGVYAVEWTLNAVVDPTLAKAYSINLTNAVHTL